MAAASVLLMVSTAMMPGRAMMLRMDFFADHLADECREECAMASAARMHAESDDTHKVPYSKH